MRKTTFIFAGIISAVIGTAFAAGENTVTSKSYVDAQDALKQNKLHTASATPANNGTTVVTYTDAEGTPGERGIFDYDTGAEYDDNTGDYIGIAEGREGDLLTAGDVIGDIQSLYSEQGNLSTQIQGIGTQIDGKILDQPTLETSKLSCANFPDCTLWTIQSQTVVNAPLRCSLDSDCREYDCPSVNEAPHCSDAGMCHCSSR